MKHISPYASKDLIYIYDNLDSPFLINPLNIRTQIRKSPSASVESSKRAKDVTRMSTLRFAKKYTHTQTAPATAIPNLCTCPRTQNLTVEQEMAARHQQMHILILTQNILRRLL